MPVPDPVRELSRERILVTGDPPSPINPPSGCRFRTRCPKFANELWENERLRCVEQSPALVVRKDAGSAHPSACHYAEVRAVV